MKAFLFELIAGSFFLVFWLIFLLGLRFAWISYSEGLNTMYLPWVVKKEFVKWIPSRKSKRNHSRVHKRSSRREMKNVRINRNVVGINFDNNSADNERLEIIKQYLNKSA